jgi:hypothetical protein
LLAPVLDRDNQVILAQQDHKGHDGHDPARKGVKEPLRGLDRPEVDRHAGAATPMVVADGLAVWLDMAGSRVM